MRMIPVLYVAFGTLASAAARADDDPPGRRADLSRRFLTVQEIHDSTPWFVHNCPVGSEFRVNADPNERTEYCLSPVQGKVGAYYQQGRSKTEQGFFMMGRPQGHWVLLSLRGSTAAPAVEREEQEFDQGQPVGTWKWFDGSGVLRKQVTYEKGVEVAWSGADYDEAIARSKAVASTVRVRLSGKPGSVIREGSAVCTKNYLTDYITFVSVLPVRLPTTGSMDALFVASESKPHISLPKGALSHICTPTIGWTAALSIEDTLPASGLSKPAQ